ncbi:MAG TPA: hypothetical protein DIT32_00090 [Peptococcaceae bacterium]|nr:hypothetical protein [Peptococcaceae bacterium]
MIKQISLFLENKKGRLAHVCRAMGEEGINIRALSIADTTDFGVLRLIVDDPQKAETQLKARGFSVTITDVVGIKVADRPGGLAEALDFLDDADVSVEYMYAFLGKCGDQAMVILRLNDTAKGLTVLTNSGIEIMEEAEAYNF